MSRLLFGSGYVFSWQLFCLFFLFRIQMNPNFECFDLFLFPNSDCFAFAVCYFELFWIERFSFSVTGIACSRYGGNGTILFVSLFSLLSWLSSRLNTQWNRILQFILIYCLADVRFCYYWLVFLHNLTITSFISYPYAIPPSPRSKHMHLIRTTLKIPIGIFQLPWSSGITIRFPIPCRLARAPATNL